MTEYQQRESENDFLQRLSCGDEKIFRLVYDRYKSKLYWYCFRFTRSGEVSEEIVHDVFVKLWEQRHCIVRYSSVGAFVYTLARNMVLNYLKKDAVAQAYSKEKSISATNIDTSTEMQVEYDDYLALTKLAITRLPHQRKLIFMMSREGEMSNKEIAVALGISTNTVKSQLVKALKFIRATLDV